MDVKRGDPNDSFEVEGQESLNRDSRTPTPDSQENDQSRTLTEDNRDTEGQTAYMSQSDYSATASPRHVDPILSDEDDAENSDKAMQPDMKEVVSDTDLSVIVQDNASDRDIRGTPDILDDMSHDKLGSVSDDNELNLSTDNYMAFPVSKPNRSFSTDDLISAVYDDASVISDIFEPTLARKAKSQSSLSRYDTLRSKYTRPRPVPNRERDLDLTYLPARGLRSHAPFLKTFPHSDYTLEEDIAVR